MYHPIPCHSFLILSLSPIWISLMFCVNYLRWIYTDTVLSESMDTINYSTWLLNLSNKAIIFGGLWIILWTISLFSGQLILIEVCVRACVWWRKHTIDFTMAKSLLVRSFTFIWFCLFCVVSGKTFYAFVSSLFLFRLDLLKIDEYSNWLEYYSAYPLTLNGR